MSALTAPRARTPLAATADTDLYAAARAGDRWALDELVGRHRSAVAAVCRRRLRRPQDVDDAVQETFARALDALGQLRDPCRFGPWIRTIAANVCTEMGTRGAREIAVDGLDSGRDPWPLPEEQVVDREDASALHARLGSLGERDRRALWLRDALGVPVPEVADDLGVTPGSARVLLARARGRLRDTYAGIAALVVLVRTGLRERVGRVASAGHPGWLAGAQAAAVVTVAALPVGLGPPQAPAPNEAVLDAPPAAVVEAPAPATAVAPAEPAPPPPPPPAPAAPKDPAPPAPTEVGPVRVGEEPPQDETVTATVADEEGPLVEADLFAGELLDAVAGRAVTIGR